MQFNRPGVLLCNVNRNVCLSKFSKSLYHLPILFHSMLVYTSKPYILYSFQRLSLSEQRLIYRVISSVTLSFILSCTLMSMYRLWPICNILKANIAEDPCIRISSTSCRCHLGGCQLSQNDLAQLLGHSASNHFT